jgi:S1-C subfamily serine protease
MATLLGAAVVATATTNAKAAGPDFSAGASVVQVHASPASGRKVSLGSGVVTDKNRVVTNCHVIRDAQRVVVSKGALRFDAVAQHADIKRDICVLDVPTLSAIPARVGSSGKLRRGEPLIAFGFPRATGLSASFGEVVALHKYRGDFVIETSTAIAGGSSGGGIFNEAGQLVGLATFFSASSHPHYFALPTSWISAVGRAPKRAIEPLLGIPFWQDRNRLPPFLRILLSK